MCAAVWLGVLLGALAHGGAEGDVVDEGGYGVDKCLVVVVWGAVSCDAVCYQIGGTAGAVYAHYGEGALHGFQNAEREAFGLGTEQQYASACVFGGYIGGVGV